MGTLSGKTALVTGGSSGIGLATAKLFVDAGAQVIVTGQDAGRLVAAGAMLGPQASTVRSDSGSLEAVHALARHIEKMFGGLDLLFLNAGTGRYAPLAEVEKADFDRIFDTNVKGPMFLVKALAPTLRTGGAVTFVSSITNRMGMPESLVYSASKGAIASMVRVLAGELAGQGIRVNAIAPGAVSTNLGPKLQMSAKQRSTIADKLANSVPLGRIGRPEEIAGLALFLAGSEASYITGQEFVVDGGWSGVMR